MLSEEQKWRECEKETQNRVEKKSMKGKCSYFFTLIGFIVLLYQNKHVILIWAWDNYTSRDSYICDVFRRCLDLRCIWWDFLFLLSEFSCDRNQLTSALRMFSLVSSIFSSRSSLPCSVGGKPWLSQSSKHCQCNNHVITWLKTASKLVKSKLTWLSMLVCFYRTLL